MYDHTHPFENTNGPEEKCPSAMRNRYFKRKNMMASDFTLEQNYGIDRRRLLNRAIHGWGVAYGFELAIDDSGHLLCGTGLALDKHGRELFRADKGEVLPHDIFVPQRHVQTEQPEQPERVDQKTGESESHSSKYLLRAHYAERPAGKIRVDDSCGCGQSEWNHLCETMVFSLEPLCGGKGCECIEPPCLACCRCAGDGGGEQMEDACFDRGPHYCLCQWLTKRDVPCGSGDLCNWNGVEIALNDAVPLACVTVRFDKCDHPLFDSIDDPCTPRRLVKTNDLLFDLIRGCDLTHISEVSWGSWHRRSKPIDWKDFKDMFLCAETIEKAKEYGQQQGTQIPNTRFRFQLSCPVQAVTLTADCFVITVLFPDDRTGWINALRVPVTGLIPDKTTEGDPEGTTRGATIRVDADWCDDEIFDRTSIFRCDVASVEIEIRGDLILDCGGQAVDANTQGLKAAPTGNGTPGGNYLSTFRVSRPVTESHAQS